MDAPRQIDVGGTVIAAIARPLHRLQLWKARLPIAQDMLRDSELLRQFANGQ